MNEVWAVVHSNYEPSEVHSLWRCQAKATESSVC